MLAQHCVDPARGCAGFGNDLDDVGKCGEAKLQSAEPARLDDAKDAETVEVGDGLRHHVACRRGRGGTLGQNGDQRACLLQVVLFLGGQRLVHQWFMPRAPPRNAGCRQIRGLLARPRGADRLPQQ